MDITITFEDGRWTTDPNPAIVLLGAKVRFVVRIKRSPSKKLEWTIDFKGKSPFKEKATWRIKTEDSNLGDENSHRSRDLRGIVNDPASRDDIEYDHRGASAPAETTEPGGYKYDLKVENVANGTTVGKEDPILIVLDTAPSV